MNPIKFNLEDEKSVCLAFTIADFQYYDQKLAEIQEDRIKAASDGCCLRDEAVPLIAVRRLSLGYELYHFWQRLDEFDYDEDGVWRYIEIETYAISGINYETFMGEITKLVDSFPHVNYT